MNWQTTAEDIVCQYPDLFNNNTVGKLKSTQVSLRVKDVNPVFTKPRVVPFAIRSKYEETLKKLVEEDIVEKLDKVVYLGTIISVAGISPTKEKVHAIQQAAPPASATELQSFLGNANFLRKFVPDFAKIASPLCRLLRKGTPWEWGKPEQDAFDKIKAALCSDSTLLHYDPAAELVLQSDASSVGVGATLLQPGPGSFLQTVAYASRILNIAEKNYSQIERESSAIVLESPSPPVLTWKTFQTLH
ncbi:Transposon Tf2-6 polyprotein [Stylophora pistillata]|uniref:Transposon Tf2-6 polyprotein n=1 Tax=Stylophora pistillata TaxID=50429 RepID=A0A2B4RAC5_STYPI|nr:Transposon Tf2-6 polyprotein [Stylophora pistillata]